jgi:cytochrome oxidase Cu insertion factor (SCO1/SenC/PrrC family)
MKLLLGTFFLFISAIAVCGQTPQSPLAPPVLPPAEKRPASLKVGDKAPEFTLPNADGKPVALSEYTARTPVVLVFYRGYW